MITVTNCKDECMVDVYTGGQYMLREKMDAIINHEDRLKGAIAGIHVVNAKTNQTLYNHMEDVRLHPASNMKLLSGAAALIGLGEDYTFQTKLAYDGSIDKNVLNGDIYIQGKGDPTILPEDIEAFARTIQSLGITQINGEIYVDDFHFDHIRLSPGLVWGDQPYYYGSQISALTISPNKDYDTGTICLTIEPADGEGKKPTIKSYPQTAYVHIQNEATTGKETHEPLEDSELEINRLHGTNNIVLSGSIPLKGETEKIWVSVWEPSLYVGTLLKEALERKGIITQDEISRKVMPSSSSILEEKTSIPLKEILISFMKLSNNGLGEMFVKELGKLNQGIGGWEEGLEELMKILQPYGIEEDHVDVRDGSGLSHGTTISAKAFTNFLYNIQSEEWFSIFLHSLPIAGEEDRMIGGTLSERMPNIHLRAKTGTIDGVSTLSGYLTTKTGEQWIVSILLNNVHEKDSETIKEVEDKMIALLFDE